MTGTLTESSSVNIIDIYPLRANLYPLTLSPRPQSVYELRREVDGEMREEAFLAPIEGAAKIDPVPRNVSRALLKLVMGGFKREGYKVSRKQSKIIKVEKNYAPSGSPLQIYPSFELRVLCFNDNYYLCVDHHLVVRAVLSLAVLLQKDRSLHLNPAQRALVKVEGESTWDEGRVTKVEGGNCHITLFSDKEVIVPEKEVYPELTRMQIAQLAPALNVRPDELERSIKQYSFLTAKDAPRARLHACTEFAEHLSQSLFPVSAGEVTIRLEPFPAVLRPPSFVVGSDIQEPSVSFDHVDRTKRGVDILKGLVSFGAYDKPTAPIGLVLIATRETRTAVERLVQRLNRGSMRYPGARKTFGGEMQVRAVLEGQSVEEYEDRIREFVRTEAATATDVALVFMPKDAGAINLNHPYYSIKGRLLKEGIVSQMVDRSTVYNPEWRDLNLALNIYAKAGYAPWVLDEAVEGVDLFIGLSSSTAKRGRQVTRMMSYVNVFDSYGRWKFYEGDAKAFDFDERLAHYEKLVKESVAAYRAEKSGNITTVHIHLTKPFSAQERNVISAAVRASSPGAAVVFVSVNANHALRMYDLSEANDGRVMRSTYLVKDGSRLYLATTGSNIFDSKSNMGTPIPLELTVWADPPEARPTLSQIGQQILSLTRLNWASTRSFCHEPITTKYAGDIAKLMTAFMQDPEFAVNSKLRGVPWFL
jgi:hypothetical protein